MVIESKENEK